MAFTYGFYNAVNHDRRYDAVQWGQVFDGIIKDGIYETYKKAMIVRASSMDNTVIIQPGRAWFDHTWSYNDADLSFTMPAPEVALDRIDAIVLDINGELSSRINSFQVVKGTPADNPSRPTLINSGKHHQYPLAYVKRYYGQTKIYARDITNMVGTSSTPFVTGVIEGLHIDDLLAQWADEFAYWIKVRQDGLDAYQQELFEWIENQKLAYNEFLAHNSTAWNNWFSHVVNELDHEQYGHLQNQIDAISFIYVIDNVLYLPLTGVSVNGEKAIFLNKN